MNWAKVRTRCSRAARASANAIIRAARPGEKRAPGSGGRVS